MKKCLVCGKRFEPSKSARKGICCSIPCRQKWIAVSTAKKRGDLLRGRGEGKTYTKRSGRHEHRIVAEKKIGRSLRPGEIVHHINGDRKDNRPKNLIVITQSQHIHLHHQEMHNAYRTKLRNDGRAKKSS